MVQIQKPISIPDYCPICNERLHHINALNTKAKCYIVFCKNSKCRFCQEYKQCHNCGELVCL